MDFIAADILSPSSGSPADRGVGTARAAPSPSSSGIRRSFSAVLQGARGEERRGETRESDDVRSTDKSDREPRSKETKDTVSSPARAERDEASSSHAGGESRSNDDESNRAEVSKTDSESAEQEGHTGSGVQGHEPAAMLTLISFQTIPAAIGQPEVRPEGEVHAEEESNRAGVVHSSESDAEASDGSSKSSLIPLAMMEFPASVSDSAEDRSTPHKKSTPLLGLPEQELDATALQSENDSQTAQVAKQSPNIVVDDSGSEAGNLVENPTVSVEPQPGSALLNPDSVARRAFHAYLGAVSSDGKSEPSKQDSGKHEEALDDHHVSTQGSWHAQSLDDHENIGAKTKLGFPLGQQPSLDLGEHFNELWTDQNGLQPDHAITKLPQAAVVEVQVANGQPAGQVVAGVHSQSLPGSTAPPSTTSFASQPQPAVPAHDTAEKSVHMMARSVVLDLARPDLGHVNIRVAMMNDVVHTHLSADRPEVGQFLINGQDRLQAAFQANGLDMGQFRVDIDRQSAGRSFHHGPPHEQGQTWNQDSHGMKWGQSPDRQDEQRMSLHGLLNVVA